LFISEAKSSKLTVASTDRQPQVEIEYGKAGTKEKETSVYDFDMLIDVKGWKAMGNKLPNQKISKVKLLAVKPSDDVETKIETEKVYDESITSFEPGSTISLDIKKKNGSDDQLGLF
ncbi:MAG: DNA gyrase/topoisomerase IV subunit A, partial [Bacteroidota bacterium]|nr:DNA gyrase/topoisomerase IV subunit A [Bacteroidota bacterium]